MAARKAMVRKMRGPGADYKYRGDWDDDDRIYDTLNNRRNASVYYNRGFPKPMKRAKKKPVSRRSKIFAPIGGMLGGAAGGWLGGPAGAVLGSSIGSSAGSLISKITGFGSYQVARNTLVNNSIPQFQSRLGDGSIRIKHKEFISDVVSSATPGAFNPIQYHISASDQNTFPYLSQLAVNFEEYAFEGLVFQYITSSGSISTTGQLGTVVGATQFNALAAPYANKQQMEASTFGQSTVASQSCLFPVECDAKQTPSNGIFYNQRPGISNVDNDLRWSRLGNFTLATVGMPNASETVGELYVSYDIVLMKPILIQDSGASADHWQLGSGIVAGSVEFGTNPVLTAQSDNFTRLGGTTILINPSFNGNLCVMYYVNGVAGLWVSPDMTAGVGVTDLNVINLGTANNLNVATAATSAYAYSVGFFTVQSTGVESVITLGSGTYFSPTNGDLYIMQIPADFD